jgi:hypothetical protein
MPRKSSRSAKPAQEKISQQLHKQTAAQYREEQAKYKSDLAAYTKKKKQEATKRDKELKTILKKAERVGLYSPRGSKLTPYRRRRALELGSEYREYLLRDSNFFLPVKKEKRKEIKERANNLEIFTTKTGIFIPKAGHTHAKIKYDRKHKEHYIERSGKTKSGINRGRIYVDVTPMAKIDELDKARERLRRLAKRLCPLKGTETLVIKVSENGVEGWSKKTFGGNGEDCEAAIDALIRWIDTYHDKDVAAKIQFFRHVTIEKWESVDKFYEAHPPRQPGKKHRQRITKRERIKGRK